MVGHMKFCLTLLSGYLVFNESVNFLQMLGIILTFTGNTYFLSNYKSK